MIIMHMEIMPGVKIIFFLVIAINIEVCQPWTPPVYSIELESELREGLFNGYNVMQRPEKRVPVRTALNLLSLNYLDIRAQQLSVTAYFHFSWMDSRLEWISNSTFNNIRYMFSTEKDLWTPALIVENSVDNIDVISKPAVPLRIDNRGIVTWFPAGIFTTHCESDVTYWPLDTQTCDITLSSWSYTGNEVELLFDFQDTGIVMEFYQGNGEWELLSNTHKMVETERQQESFSRLVFSFSFRRRPLFHMLNTLFPVVLMGFLTVAIFKLSPESGERVGLALTILLAYAVYLGLISENIPQTSMSASLLSSYLASTLFLQTLAVLLTVIYLDIYFTPETKPIPKWLQITAQSCLARVACMECNCPTTKGSRINPKKTDDDAMECVVTSKDTLKERPDSAIESGRPSIEVWADNVNDDVTKDYSWKDGVTKGYLWKDEATKEYSWKEIALMLDKVTMYIYLLFVTTLTVVWMIVMLNHYASNL